MANKTLFQSLRGLLTPATTTVNKAGAGAYAYTPRHAIAQLAATGCLNATFYSTAEAQLKDVLDVAAKVDTDFLAKAAIFARERGHMKDMPALLCAMLAKRDVAVLRRVFTRVIDNGKMLRNFVQMVRSGVAGRKSLGSAPKKLVQDWLAARGDAAVFRATVGNTPSLADIVKMVHPKPSTSQRQALFAYMVGRAHDAEALPELVRQFEAFKRGATLDVPDVPFEMLTALPLGEREWTAIASAASWTTTRMNLNTFARHGVFSVPAATEMIAKRLKDPELVRKAKVFPYQLLATFTALDDMVPFAVREALQDALEIALENVPKIDGRVIICPDVSGSMHSPVTGTRKGATSKVTCVQAAALVAAAMLRKNPGARVIPFEQDVVNVALNPRDSVMTNAERLGSIGGGGTNCSAPLAMLNQERAQAELVVYVSDNQSWVDANSARQGTGLMAHWNLFRERNRDAKLACIDLAPYGTSQATEREDILNIGGFSDAVFEILAEFAAGRLHPEHWVGVIDKIEL